MGTSIPFFHNGDKIYDIQYYGELFSVKKVTCVVLYKK
jgi:hypothetical protein